MTGSPAPGNGGNSGDGVRESLFLSRPSLACLLLNAEIEQGVGSSGDGSFEMADSAREGRSVRRVLSDDSAREAVEPALVRVSGTTNEDGGRLVVPLVVDMRLDGRCSLLSSRSWFAPFCAVFFPREFRLSILSVK